MPTMTDLLALDVGLSGRPEELADTGTADSGRGGLDSRLDAGQDLGQVACNKT